MLPVKMRPARHHVESSSGWPIDMDSSCGSSDIDMDSSCGSSDIDMDCSCDMLIPSLFLICVLVRYAGMS